MKYRVLAVILFCVFSLKAQTQKELADKYLKERGELVFSFTANNVEEIKQLTRIISFDRGHDRNNPLKVNAVANKKNFNEFLKFNLPFEVNIQANEPKNVVMFDPKIHKKGVSGKSAYTALTFPLTAYPTYAQYVAQMNEFVATHPTIARIENIGTTPGSAAGTHDLLFIVLSDNIGSREAEPRVMYTSSIHGDEIAGYPMMLSLVDYLINAYTNTGNSDHTRVKNLLDNSEIWINPLANPDGTFRTSNTSVANAIRGNANAIDMNRNYPEPEGSPHPDGKVYQSETIDFMNLADNYHFVLSANFHGGAEVVNYPWDFTYDRHIDDTWLINVSKEYADNVQADGPSGYFTDVTNSGYTHGADWYRIAGGRQDYMTYEKHGREITMEISSTKLIPANQIQNHWNYNREALLDYLLQGTYGFRGIVKDAITGTTIDAKITIVGRDDQPLSRNSWVKTELPLGDFYRPIEAGTYDILIEAECYTSVTLTNQSITNYHTINLGDILLSSATANAPSALNESNVTTTTATLNWDDANVTSYDIWYREQGTSTWTQTTSSTNAIDINGLNTNTTYEFQVRGVCNATPSGWSSLKTFSTLAANYCIVSGSNVNFEYISAVAIDSNSNTSANENGGYSDFTGLTPFSSLDLNTQYSISVTKFWPGNQYNEDVEVWIDYNQDGDFEDSGENIYSGNRNTNSPVGGSFTIPDGASLGNTRMRVIMRDNNISGPCISFTYGEVEDYTVNIVDSTLGIQDELLSTFTLYPNPSDIGEIRLKMPNEIQEFNVDISNILGQKLYTNQLNNASNKLHTISTQGFKTGIYFVSVSTPLGKSTKKLVIE